MGPSPAELDNLGLELVCHSLVDVDALDRAADLPRVAERVFDSRRRSLLDVGVIEHDHRVLAPELEHEALQRSDRARHDRLAGGAAADEADHVDIRVDKSSADVSRTMDDLQDPFGKLAVEQLEEPLAHERRVLARLEHDGVARGQRG